MRSSYGLPDLNDHRLRGWRIRFRCCTVYWNQYISLREISCCAFFWNAEWYNYKTVRNSFNIVIKIKQVNDFS